jgi:hypothetical protein
MAQTCSKCSRANPAEAVYCYFDGFVLGGGNGRNGGPVAVGAQTFGHPFVFPGGHACRSFDELALACQQDWSGACDLLAGGYLENFFGGLGRVDLALAAKEASKFPDRDRGLDQLLAKLPSEVLAEPTLRVEPQEVNLGVIDREAGRKFDLHLENQGMRLLYGSINSGEGWLALGEAPGASEKHFQFHHEQTVPVQVRTEKLRAGKPVEAKLLIASNAGSFEVVVRAEVPVKPFPSGVLAGAKSPRQAAEKAKGNPKGAAPLFEDGSVAEWYKQNGWTYPVQGPPASGLGAVQQFFEALGLTPPPKVHINAKAVALEGKPGDMLRYTLEVKSEEKRPVYAHGTSTEPWLEVGRAKLNGRVATIQVTVPSVPDRPGETLTARLSVQSNGNQRFVVPVTLQVASNAFDFGGLGDAPPRAAPRLAPEPPPPPPSSKAAVATQPAVELEMQQAVMAPPPPPLTPTSRRGKRGKPAWAHAIPALLLGLALGGVVASDAFSPVTPAEDKEEAESGGGGSGGGGKASGKSGTGLSYELSDPELRLSFLPNANGNYRFGLILRKETDPANPDQHKRLTFQENGASNNTCVKIDGYETLYGKKGLGRMGSKEVKNEDRHYWRTTWDYPDKGILVTQEVQIVPGAQSGLLDTCLVLYTVKNRGSEPRKVGLRVMFDTFIGTNDGVPFVVPGHKGLVTTPQDFSEKEIPDYVQALEKPDLKNPGTVAHLGLKGFQIPGVSFEPIKRMVIRPWPGSEALWEPELDPKEKSAPIKDSCILLYWDYRTLPPKEEWHMAFSYGLNAISTPEGGGGAGGAAAGGTLALTAGGSFVVGNDFTVTALVKEPKPGQKVKLDLPAGLELLENEKAEQEVVAKGDYTQVSWRVRSKKVGTYTLTATSPTGARASSKIKITDVSLFR